MHGAAGHEAGARAQAVAGAGKQGVGDRARPGSDGGGEAQGGKSERTAHGAAGVDAALDAAMDCTSIS